MAKQLKLQAIYPDPECSICSDARLGRICARCQHDPANEGWSDGQEFLATPTQLKGYEEGVLGEVPWNEMTPWSPDKTFCDIVRLLHEGVPQREISRRLSVSRGRVARVAAEVGL